MSARFYVASRASAPERPAMWRAMRDQGCPIIATWIDEAGQGETACNRELWSRIEREVTGATALIFYAEPEDFPLKGALVEVGMALAAGVPVRVVTPGVVLEPRSLRPLGSWAMHPLVSFYDTVQEATPASSVGTNGEAGREQKPVITELVEALRPFADFVTPDPKWMADADVVTMGSPMARKQITAGQCRAARAALSRHSQTGNGEVGA